MTEKDLFNAINEIDTKYITDAWQNTEAEPLVIESGKTSKLKIFGVAAAFAAAVAAICLVVHIRVNYPNVTPPDNSLSVHSPGDVLPADIHGPDGVRITYGDVTKVSGADRQIFAADEITEDNWQEIVCDGFTYLSMPYRPYSSVPLQFDRYNVGDSFCGLTVKSASTMFQYHYKGEPTYTPNECSVEFDGTVTVNGYIMYDDDRNLICVPLYNDYTLPMIYPCEELKMWHKIKNGDFEYNTDKTVLYLDNDNDLDIFHWLGIDDYADVTLTLSNVRMYSVSSMKMPNYARAVIESIDEYYPEISQAGELPFALFGPDHVQIRYEDIGQINYKYTASVLNDSQLTEDNWDSIYCYGFGYITQPTGNNFNSIDNPELFDEYGYIGSADLIGTMGEYKRINVGEKFGNLTLRGAETAFYSASAVTPQFNGTDPKLRFDSCILNFDGSVSIDAYLVRSSEYEQIICVPLYGETSLPLLMPFATSNEGTFYSPWWRGRFFDENIKYLTELPGVYLEVPDSINLDDYLARGECKLVNLTLDNITAVCRRRAENLSSISADIVEINEVSQ